MTNRLVLPCVFLIASAGSAMAQSDSCSTPTPVAGYGDLKFSTVGATSDGIAQSGCGPGQVYNDVWFCWTAPESALVEASLCGTPTFDTVMAVYGGCGCPAPGSALACNDDSCACASGCGGNFASRVQWVAQAGQQYMVRVGAYSATGTGAGSVSIATVPPLVDVINPANGHRYIGVAGSSWSAAESFAQQLGGHLVSIGDADENAFVQLNFGVLNGVSQRLWIGFNDVAVEGSFEWSDATPPAFTNWNGGEPNNAGAGEDVAEMLGGSGLWNDMPDSGGGYAHLAVIEFGQTAPPPCLGDLDQDGQVSGFDLGILLGQWGQAGQSGDLDGDGFTAGSDLGLLLGNWGACG